MTEAEQAVIDAALAFQEEWRDDFYTKTMRTEALSDFLEVVRAYRKSLEPRERYSVRFTQDGHFGRHQVMDDLKNGIAPSIIATCSLSGDAERIAALLNKEEGK
jgi:hypothetical protein